MARKKNPTDAVLKELRAFGLAYPRPIRRARGPATSTWR
jgi:hypothetical protein